MNEPLLNHRIKGNFNLKDQMRGLLLVPLFLLLMLFSFSAKASHFRYGAVTATRLSETATTVTYRINVAEAWRLGAAPGSTFFFVTGGNSTSFTVATTTVTDPSGQWSNTSGSTTVTLNKSATLTRIESASCCKVSNLSNNHDLGWDEYIVLATGAPGSSPVSSMPAIINMPVNASAATFSIPASDPDAGSTLTFGLPNLTSGGLAGEVEPPNFSVTPSGQITMNTNGLAVGQIYNAMVTVTDNNGNQIMLDFIIQMVGPSNPPVFNYAVTPPNGTTYNVTAGQNFSFNLKATDVDAGSFVKYSVSGLPSYLTTSNFSPALPAQGNPALTTFSWTPAAAQIGSTVLLNLIATDNVGVQTTTSVTIKVVAEPAPTFINPTPGELTLRQVQTNVLMQDIIKAQSSLGSNISINFATVPAGATLSPAIPTPGTNPGMTTMSWTPTAANWGIHNFQYTAAITAFPTIFTIRNYQVIANTSPAFSSTQADIDLTIGQLFSYTITVADPDMAYGDQVDIVAAALPSWLTLTAIGNGKALLTGTPTANDGGNFDIDLEAEDTYHHGNPSPVEQSFTLNVLVCNTTLASTVSNTSCPSAADGSIDLVVTGGKAPFVYSWSNGATTEDISSLAAGTYTVSVTDANLCNSILQVVVGTNPDIIAPIVPVLADVTSECSATATAPTTIDNCAGTVTGTTADALTYTTQGVHVIHWSFDDGNGNVSTATQNVIIKDITAPVVPILADVTGECSATATAPTTIDNCAGTVTGTTADALTYTTQGVHVIHWSFDDGNGNVSAATQNVVIKDITAPILPVLADVTGECSATAIVPTALDNCTGLVTGVTSDALSYTTQGVHVIHWTFDDGNGNTSLATQNVIVKDVTAPVVPVLANVTGQCSATATVPTTTDNCAGVVTGITSDALSYSSQGTFVIHWTFKDGNGNVSLATQNVIVKDVTAPVVPVLANVIGQCSATAKKPTTIDNCAGVVTGTTSDTLSYSSQGVHVIHWTFKDGNGNVSFAQQLVIVKDNIAPVVPVLANVTGQCSATATVPTTTDNCAGVITGTTSNALTYSAQGTFVIHWSFNDGNGNISTAQQLVVVKDDIAPIVVTNNIMVQLNTLGAVSITAAQINNGSTDNCGIATYALSKSSFDCSNVGPNTVTLIVTDTHGNVGSEIATVTVSDNTAPIVVTKNITVQLNPAGSAIITSADVDKGSTDNCGIQTYSLSKSTFDCSNVGANTVTLTIVDKNGNSSTGTAIVTVQDNIAPIITQPLSQQICFVASNTYSLPTLVATDNCGVASINYVMSGATTRSGNTANASGLLNTGLTTISWEVTDRNGNVSTATNTIQIWPLPVVSIATNSPDDFCNQVTLTANSNIAGLSYNWVYNNTTFSTNQIINLNQSNKDGVYSLYVTDIHGCTNTLVASYNFVRQNLSNIYTILAYKEVELGQNNTVASGSVGVMSAKGDVDLKKGSSVASVGAFIKAPKMDVNDKSVNVPTRIFGVATVALPTMYYNTTTTKGLPNYDVKSGSVTLSGNYGTLTIRKGASATLSGNTFGTIHLEQTASVKFTSATVNFDKLQIDPSSSKAGYSNVSFASDTRVLVSTSVSIGSHAIINANNYKVTFYVGTTSDKSKRDDDWDDDERFSVKGGDVKLIANVYMPTGKLRINGGSSSDDDNDDCFDSKTNKMVAVNTYMTGLFIASEVEGGGKNVIWNNYNCSAPTISASLDAGNSNLAVTPNADTVVTVKPIVFLAYPNPFGKITTVSFSVPTNEQSVTLEVYNSFGLKVATLYKGSAQSNVNYSYVFDGSNLLPGTYFARLLTAGSAPTVRLVMGQ